MSSNEVRYRCWTCDTSDQTDARACIAKGHDVESRSTCCVSGVCDYHNAVNIQRAEARDHNTAVSIARRFHEAYERLAPDFGYETRAESAVPWDQLPARNQLTMVATVQALLEDGVIRPRGLLQEQADVRWVYRQLCSMTCDRHDISDGERAEGVYDPRRGWARDIVRHLREGACCVRCERPTTEADVCPWDDCPGKRAR